MSLYKKVEKIYKSTLFSRHDKDDAVFYFSASDFPGMLSQLYDIRTSTSDTIKGVFYSYENPKMQSLVVFEHGMGAGHESYMNEIEMLCRAGFLVFAYDHIGCDRSSGEGIRGFAGSLFDLDTVISALKEDDRCSAREISVVGHSWGAFSALNISALHPDIKNIVALSGFISVKDMQSQVIPAPLFFYRKRLYELEKRTNPDHVDYCAVNTLNETSSNILVIHSSDDKTVSAKRHFDKMRKKMHPRDNITFLSLSGKDHNPNYTRDAVAYKKRFQQTLKKKRKAGELNSIEQRTAFKASFDFHKMTEQDSDVWNIILAFLEK